MNASKEIPKDATLEVRDPGRRKKGDKKKTRQVLMRLDEAEVESLQFYWEITGMSFSRILKFSAILGSLAFPYAYLLAKLDKRPDNEFSSYLTGLCQEAAREFGAIMQEKYDAAKAKAEEVSDV